MAYTVFRGLPTDGLFRKHWLFMAHQTVSPGRKKAPFIVNLSSVKALTIVNKQEIELFRNLRDGDAVEVKKTL